VTNTHKNYGHNAVAEVSCAAGILCPEFCTRSLRRMSKRYKTVKHFRTIHTLWSLPDQGGDVCKVWFRLVQKCESV